MKTRLLIAAVLSVLLAWPAFAGPPAQPLTEGSPSAITLEHLPLLRAPGDPVDFATALAAGASYLQAMQADITDDNAGNGWNGVNETPDDPDDAGWDWSVNLTDPLHHTTEDSPTNLYGVTALGLLAAYMGGGGGGGAYLTALNDAAGIMLAAGTADIRTASDMIFLLLYDDLAEIAGSTYADAARAKYDARIAAHGSATAFAVYLRDTRGVAQGYPNGIIGWDLGAYAKVAAMLDARYPGNGYDTQADDIAEVLWQDSFNDNPGLFDVVDDAGWDPTWSNVNFWWYTLGLTGLIDAFQASGSHTAEIPGLIARLEDSTFSNGAMSGSYGAHATDEDWQSTAYAAMSLAFVDKAAHQGHINRLAYWIGATQDASGAWAYSDGEHYPEVGGENTTALALAEAPTAVLVDDGFVDQAAVDVYNTAHGTHYVYGFDAFATIQAGIDAVSGSTVTVLAGTYTEQLHITTSNLTITGAGVGVTVVKAPASCPSGFTTYYLDSYGNPVPVPNHPAVFVDGATGVALLHLTIDGDHKGSTNYRFSGVAFWNGGGSLVDAEILNVMDTAFSGNQHGVGLYAYNNTGGPYTIVVNDVQVLDFQKNGLALMGEGLAVDLDGVTTIGQGPTAVTAQNGIQIGYGASGTVDDCVIEDVAYTGTGWTATGFLLQGGGTVAANNVDIDGCQTSVYWIDTNGSYAGSAITNPIGDAYYAYSSSPGRSAGQPRIAAQPLEEDYSRVGGRALVTAAVTNSTITGTGLTDSWGVTGFSDADGPLDFTVTGCTISNWDYGIVCYDFDDTVGSVITAEVHDNDVMGSGAYGMYANTVNTQDATDNWWGHASGPYHSILNPSGLGDPVSDHVDFDPYVGQATFTLAASTNGPINCSQSSTLTFSYAPGAETPPMRGYSLLIPVSSPLAFTAADFHVNSLLWPEAPDGAESFFDVTFDIAAQGYRVDYSLMGVTGGITIPVELFTLVVDGSSTGSGVIQIDSCKVRDLSNQPIGADFGDAETILVDCTAPDLPELTAEPAFTQGLSNTVFWSDEVASGAVAYYAECASDASFVTVVGNSGWIAGLSHNFGGLSDATPYWYRVKAKDALDNETGWSVSETSTQDATPPTSSASALAAYQNSWSFDVAWTGSDATSGVASAQLSYNQDDSGWTSAGSGAASPIPFVAGSDGVYEFYTIATDNVGNVEAAPGTADVTTIVDTTDPSGSFAINSGAGYTNSLSVSLVNAVTDLHALEMRFSNDGSSWPEGWTAYAGTQAWTLAAGADGLRTVYGEFRDAAQNVLAISDAIVYDTAAPGAVTSLAATTGHQKVTLAWEESGIAETVALEVWRAVWNQGTGLETVSAYPEYDDLTGDHQPTQPTNYAAAVASPEWDIVTTLPDGTETYTDNVVDRGIYYYVVFAVDLAANPGPPSSMVRAKNYHLGDVQLAFNGLVETGDVTVLGTAYGAPLGNPLFNPHCDVGPTTDMQPSGFPMTDNIIGFEDLMIFALNYGNVAPRQPVAGSAIAMLSWFAMEEGRWGLGLTEPCANLKALQLTAALPEGVEVELAGGSLLTQQAGPVFLRQIEGQGLDVSLALMGEGLAISGQGLLFSVTLPAGVLPGEIALTVRDAENAELDFVLDETAVADLPTVYRLAGNYPNPFNPKTTISFDLPEAQLVRLAVFGADGRRIATLLDERLAAGRHSAVWEGRDETGQPVASGVYFCRIEAGPLKETRKMLLMK